MAYFLSHTSSPQYFFQAQSFSHAWQIGPVECFKTRTVTDRTLTSLISCWRSLQLWQPVIENLCFVPKWVLMFLKMIECSSLYLKNNTLFLSGLDAGDPWATVSIPFCLSPGVYIKVKNVKPRSRSVSGWGVGGGFLTKVSMPKMAYTRYKLCNI